MDVSPQWVDGGVQGEGCSKVTREGIDEGRVAFVWSGIGFIISKKDLAKGGGKLKASGKHGDGEVVG